MQACYAGSFDPPTLGHFDVAARASRLFDRLVVAVGRNVSKSALFSPDERVAMLRAGLASLGAKIEVTTFDGLVVDFCRARGLGVLVRGLRTVADFESEIGMAMVNRGFAPGLETVFLLPAERYWHVSSRLIKEVASAGGPIDAFVSPEVASALAARLRGRT